MAPVQASKRLTKEYKHIVENPVEFISAHPSESNILEWHYIISGPNDTPFQGGQYHGTLVFPPQYPFKPPAIKMITPNGRFASSQRLCLSMSDFHPESWNPAWRVSTILTGLVSFMTSQEIGTGCVRTTDQAKKELAQRSWQFNQNNPIFKEQFPDFIGKSKNEQRKIQEGPKKLDDNKTKIIENKKADDSKTKIIENKKAEELKKKHDVAHKKHVELKKAREASRTKDVAVEVVDDEDIIILDDDEPSKPTTNNSEDPIVID